MGNANTEYVSHQQTNDIEPLLI